MKTLKWAVIGIGRFGKIHARILDQLPGSELAAIVNRNPERLAEAATEFPDARAEGDFERVLEDPDIDVVSITTHWKEHFAIAKVALEAGKHVFLEKPMAENRSQCEELLKVADNAGGRLMVGHVCRFDPRVTAAKKAIDDGRIGQIVSMHAKRNLPKAPGSIRLDKISPLMGDGIHDADIMMWFLNRAPDEVYAKNIKFGGFEYPELGWAMLSFGDDAVGVVETVWCLPEKVATTIDAKMEIIGTEGKIEIDCANTGVSIVEASGLETRPDTVYWPVQRDTVIGALPHELSCFADCIREGKPVDVITPFEAARAVAVMEAAAESAEKKQALPFSFER